MSRDSICMEIIKKSVEKFVFIVLLLYLCSRMLEMRVM